MLSVFVLLFEIFISFLASVQFYSSIWWITVILFPLVMIISRMILHPFDFYSPKAKVYLDVIYSLVMAFYVIVHIYTFYVNIGAWYGAVIGLLITYLLANLLVPNEWAKMR